MFIVDWDGTLYNTYQFVQDIYAVFEDAGVSHADAEETMKAAIFLGDKLHYDYSFERQLEALKQKGYTLKHDEVLVSLEELFETDYTMDGAVEFLKTLRTYGQPVNILTAGNEVFQKKKIHSTALHKYVDDVVCVPGDKQKYVGEVKESGPVFFINDKPFENDDVKRAHPDVHVIEMYNPHKIVGKGEAREHVPVCKTYQEILDYVREHYKK